MYQKFRNEHVHYCETLGHYYEHETSRSCGNRAKNGEYDDAHRATIIADASAAYRFESNLPPPYSGRPPHIHLRVSARNFKTLVTQHYPWDNDDVFLWTNQGVSGKKAQPCMHFPLSSVR